MTGMYNVVEKLRAGAALTPKERAIHEIAACGVLKDQHDELDALVAKAYGWPWPLAREEILERLVALHDERVAEEKRGLVRWLRPEYQIPRFGAKAGVPATELALTPGAATVAPAALPPWPATAIEQLTALTSLLAQRAVTSAEAVAAFSGASAPLVQRHLDTLALMGEVWKADGERYRLARRAA